MRRHDNDAVPIPNNDDLEIVFSKTLKQFLASTIARSREFEMGDCCKDFFFRQFALRDLEVRVLAENDPHVNIVSLRLTSDLSMECAGREGLPYQTLINSLIHKYAEGKRSR